MKTYQRLNSVIKKQNKSQQIEESSIKRVFKRSVKTNPLGIYTFQVTGSSCDNAGHCLSAGSHEAQVKPDCRSAKSFFTGLNSGAYGVAQFP